MGKASRRRTAGRELQGSARAAKDPAAQPAPFVARPFAGLPGETDWVALREVVPAATATIRFAPEAAPGDAPQTATVATVLPLAWSGLRRVDGEVMVGLQSGTTTGDAVEELSNARLLLAHEFTHVIQYGRGFPGNAEGVVLQPNWVNEAQATLAEEIVGDRVTGRARGRNYGYDVAFNTAETTDGDWYRGITLLAVYFGLSLESNPKHVPNAPEQCSFLGLAVEGNNGPCLNNDFVAYNTGYALLRWLSDQFGPVVPGGEKAIQRSIAGNRSVGLAAIASVTHVPVDTLLAQFAAALYVDDRVPGAAPRLTFSSWNLFDIDKNRINPTGRLAPRERAFSGFTDAVSVRGGSTAYFRVSGAGRAATAIRARDAGGGALPAAMRMWVVRLQ